MLELSCVGCKKNPKQTNQQKITNKNKIKNKQAKRKKKRGYVVRKIINSSCSFSKLSYIESFSRSIHYDNYNLCDLHISFKTWLTHLQCSL
jgi:hypothetical protein